jgi:uncharacterized protein YjbJ (UPF0337 family)
LPIFSALAHAHRPHAVRAKARRRLARRALDRRHARPAARAVFAQHAGWQGHAGERDEMSNAGRKVREELSLHHQVPPASGASPRMRIAWKGTVHKVGGKVREGFGRVAGDARSRAEVWPIKRPGKRKTSTGKPPIPRAKRPPHWMVGFGTRSRRSLTLLLCLRSASDGLWAGCIGLCDKESPPP